MEAHAASYRNGYRRVRQASRRPARRQTTALGGRAHDGAGRLALRSTDLHAYLAPRDEGGQGIEIANNARIPLSEAARSLYDKTCCYADILIESATDSMGVILECQGRSAHDSEAASLSDAERTTALTSMGYDVIQITYEQIKDTKSFNNIAELIHKKAGLPYIPKTDQERTAAETLRRELLVNWDELFSVKPAG